MTDVFCREGLARPAARCAAPTNTAMTPQHARIWRWRASSAGWRWRTQVWAWRTASPRRSAVCSRPRTARRAPRLLPHVMAANVAALEARASRTVQALVRYAELAHILTGKPDTTVEDVLQWVVRLCHDLSVPGLSAYGVTRADFPILAQKAAAASSMKANPIVLTPEELVAILERSIDECLDE